MTTFHKNLYERPFEAIKKGTKRIEIRANKNENSKNSINLMKEGDNIIFKKINSDEQITCTIKRITLYNSVRELLEKEGTQYTLSSTNNLEEGIIAVESISNYKELILKNGVFAIELIDVK